MKRNRVICPEVAVNGQFFCWKINFFKLPEKIEIFRKFAWKIEIILTRIHNPPRFQTRLTPLVFAGTKPEKV